MHGDILFATRELVDEFRGQDRFKDAIFYDAASRGDYGKYFSPFIAHDKIIPVPGMPGVASRTVEAVWQGLKIIEGEIDESMFDSEEPKKRRFQPYPETRFRLGDSTIGLIAARHEIYVPTYTFLYEALVPQRVKDEIIARSMEGMPQVFFDRDRNGNINNPSTSYAHSALLVELLKEERDGEVTRSQGK